jgi:HAE1 family hydrophobic/amphiphilic exporter-1
MIVAEGSIRRPIATTLSMLAILLFGIIAYRALPVSDLPNVDFPTVMVSAALPGASPETMASAVATPLEREFSTIAGVDSMTSTSSLGSTSITLQFTLDRDIDAAAQDVQAAIAKAQPRLPRDMPSPPTYRKVNPADQPVLYLALGSRTLPLSTVNEYADTFMAQRISMVSGVAQVQVYGSQKYAVRIQLDPRALASRQIGIDEVAAAVQGANVNLPTGILWGPDKALTVEATGQLTTAAAYRSVIVTYRAGSPVRLEELGRVLDSVENDKAASWFNGERAVVLAIQRQPGTNTVAVVDSIRRLLPTFRAQMPPSVELNTLYDRSLSIRDSVQDVKFTLFLALCLVVMVIFLFLRNVSATVIPSLSLPMSIVGTFSAMYLFGYSLDNLSLMALTLSVGFVVDDAIVMLENIVRHMEMGEGVLEAALKGAREIGFTIISMTLSLAAVFIPVLFLGGILGRLLHEFAVTIGVAVLVSGVVSLTLTPMLCSRFIRPPGEARHGRLYMALERFFQGMLHAYDVTLRGVLRHPFATLMASFVILAATVHLFMIIPKGFLPSEDSSQIFTMTEAAQGISYASMVEHQMRVAEIVQNDPRVESFMSSVGGGGPGGGAINSGFLFIRLKPREGRPHVDKIIEEFRPKFAGLTGIRVFMQNLPPIRIGGQLTKSQYQFTLQGPDTRELYSAAAAFEARLRELPEIQDVATNLLIKNPQVNVDIERDKASALGVTAQQIEDALYTAYGSRQVSTILAPNDQYRVIMELQPEYQQDPAALAMLYIRSSSGKLVPLDAVAKIQSTVGPLSVNHLGQLPAVTLSFNLKPGVALGEAVDKVRALARETLPDTLSTSFQGTAQAFETSQRGLGLLLLMAILVIYIVLGILYESFIHPLTILSGLPSAALGALVTLMVFRMDLNMYAFVGVIMLVGIVKKNAIMMIDFAIAAQRAGRTPQEAIHRGSLIRFRPIMMTTMAALMGTLSIALGFGAGGESRQPLGLTVVGGLLFSQLVTLYLTPVFYLYMERLQQWTRSIFRKGRAREPLPEHAGVIEGSETPNPR